MANNGDCKVLNGEEVFHLYDTFGFPVERATVLPAEPRATDDMEV